jgi:tetratricopeptide (TPR) repeat protein
VAASALLRAQNTLPPQAQAELDRGLAAAEQKQWVLAIKHFAEAQNTAKTSPQVLFNLGLAHDKAGHELAALAWLQAYLAAAPRADNANAIRKEIVRLDVATEAKINTLAKLAMDAANKMPGSSGDKAYFLGHLSEVDEAIGDFNAAYNRMDRVPAQGPGPGPQRPCHSSCRIRRYGRGGQYGGPDSRIPARYRHGRPG